MKKNDLLSIFFFEANKLYSAELHGEAKWDTLIDQIGNDLVLTLGKLIETPRPRPPRIYSWFG